MWPESKILHNLDKIEWPSSSSGSPVRHKPTYSDVDPADLEQWVRETYYHSLRESKDSYQQVQAEFKRITSLGTIMLPERSITWHEIVLFLDEPTQLRMIFDEQREQWEAETLLMSSISDMVMHPAYQRIIGMGKQVVPLLLEELEREPNHWFWALNAITGENPADRQETVDGAARAWIEWGRKKGYKR